MGMTMTQKILAKHAGVPAVEPGDLIAVSYTHLTLPTILLV